MISSVVFSGPRLKKPDVIIASSPTFFAGFSGLAISRLKRIPFIFEVRDLWPAAIAELGVIRNQTILKILESWELFLYRHTQKIVVVTQSFRENLISRKVPAAKIAVIYNGVDPGRFGFIDARTAKAPYQLEEKFAVLYTGALGISHGLEYMLQVAAQFRAEQDIIFLFVGEGARKDELQDLATQLGLSNVVFLPGQPRERMPEIYALADICFVSLKKVALFSRFIPSKIFEIMASSRPIIACLEGEAARLLEESGSALIIPQEDPAALETAIRKLYNDPGLRRIMGQSGREFAVQRFSRSKLAAEYEQILIEAMNNRYPPRKQYTQGPTIPQNLNQ